MTCHVAEALPAWVNSGKRTEMLFHWLLQNSDEILKLEEYRFVKTRVDGCLLIFSTEKKSEDIFGRIKGLHFCGIFNPHDFSLYDMGKRLRDAVGIPDDICFLTKQEIQAEAQQAIEQYGAEKIQTSWCSLLAESNYLPKQLLPAVDRTYIRKTAEHFMEEGKLPEEVIYKPKFSFDGGNGRFTDDIYLLYLLHKKYVIKAFAERWLKRNLPDISKERIIYGCIRDEMKEILWEQKNRRTRINENI